MNPRGEGRRLVPPSPRTWEGSWLSCAGGGSQERVLPLVSDDPGGNLAPKVYFIASPLPSLVAQMVKNLSARQETWVGKIPSRKEQPLTPVFFFLLFFFNFYFFIS